MNSRSVRPGACCALLLAVVVACGSAGDDADSATDPASESSASTSAEPTPSTSDSATGSGGELMIGETVEPGQAMIVSVSNVDGEPAARASALVNARALDGFLTTADARLAADVRAAVRDVAVPVGNTLFGAIVSVGCDKPTGITWTTTFDGIEAEAQLPKSGVQCLVPVTSVALFLVPN